MRPVTVGLWGEAMTSTAEKRAPRKLPLLVMGLALLAALGIMTVRSRLVAAQAGAMTRYTLIIDAGHGGVDGGATGADGSRESDINLAIALKLRALAEFYGLDNAMIRQDDSSKSPGDRYSEHDDLVCRAELVNSASNPVLISIHQNCFPTGQPSGAQVFYSEGAGSELLGRLAHTNLIKCLDPGNRRVAEPAPKKLYVLSHVSCPAILVECGFMSNFSDIGKLVDDGYQCSVSTVLMASYLQYCSDSSPVKI